MWKRSSSALFAVILVLGLSGLALATNIAQVYQGGNYNEASIEQVGDGNTALLHQEGDFNGSDCSDCNPYFSFSTFRLAFFFG